MLRISEIFKMFRMFKMAKMSRMSRMLTIFRVSKMSRIKGFKSEHSQSVYHIHHSDCQINLPKLAKHAAIDMSQLSIFCFSVSLHTGWRVKSSNFLRMFLFLKAGFMFVGCFDAR